MNINASRDFYCDQATSDSRNVSVVFENSRVLAFHPESPEWTVHIVVIPKRHIDSLLDMSKYAITANALFSAVNHIATQVTDEHGACNITTSLGEYQNPKHLQFHITSGDPLVK